MSVDWPILTLGDVCEKITDGAHNSPKSVENGKPMASVKDLTPFGVDLSEARLITKSEFEKLVKQGCQPEVGDVLIAKDGNSALDTVCTVDKPLDAVMLSSVAILRPDKSKLDSDFLKYYFCSKQVIDYLKGNFISGAAIPRVVLKDFRKAEIKVPPLAIQKEISKKLRALDAKIELNRQTNQTLEHIAQAIFKSWFVDFDPTRAKIAAKQAGQNPERAAMAAISGKALDELDQLNSEQLEQLRITAGLFPDALVDSELGELPEGWAVSSLGNEIDFATGFAFKSKDFSESGVRLARGDNVKEGQFHWGDKARYWPSITDDLEKYLLKSGDVLIGMDGSKVGKNWVRVGSSDLPCLLVQRVARLRSSGSVGSSMLEILIGSNSFRRYVENVKTGTSIPHISGKQIKELPVVNPSDGGGLFMAFESLLLPMADKREENLAENVTLSGMRDTLLPKLLSGELSVNPAEAV